MKKKFSITPNTLAVFCIMALSVVVSLVKTLVASKNSPVATVQAYQKTIVPFTILDGVTLLIILLMAFLVFKLIRNISKQQPWNDRYYIRVKTIGWLAILAMFIDAISFVGREQALDPMQGIAPALTDTKLYSDAILQLLFSSPVAWFLILCIFLTADLMQQAQESKNEASVTR